jgi:uncharacterized alpha/beta hydrolase family protein
MKKVLVAMTLVAGITSVALAALDSSSNSTKKAQTEKKTEKQEKKKECKRTCFFS